MGIAFGSDGFRGVLGHTWNCANLTRVVLGVVQYLREIEAAPAAAVPVGYDTRFMARTFAAHAARILTAQGFRPLLAHRACPTPYLSFAVHQFNAPIGLQLTASHNPVAYSGLKLKSSRGGSLSARDATRVEQLANAIAPEDVAQYPFLPDPPMPSAFNVEREYRKAIFAAAAWSDAPPPRIAVDYLHGVAAGLYREMLLECCQVQAELRAVSDPLFGGTRPEPAPELLGGLRDQVLAEGGAAAGIAFDGDGDRLAVIDERGQILAAHEIFCLLLEHLTANLDRRGVVVKTVSFSSLVDRVAEAHGCTIAEVPVGFKNVAEAMVEFDAIIGGEESGGTGFGHYLPERDALLMALLLLQARARAGTSLAEMVESLYQRYGRPVFLSRNVTLSYTADREEWRARLRGLADMTTLAGHEVTRFNHRDGMKVITPKCWVLARLSGTEPLLRVYAEGQDTAQAQACITQVLDELGLS